MTLLLVSAMKREEGPAGARPPGSERRAARPFPSAKPAVPLPARLLMLPVSESSTCTRVHMLLFLFFTDLFLSSFSPSSSSSLPFFVPFLQDFYYFSRGVMGGEGHAASNNISAESTSFTNAITP